MFLSLSDNTCLTNVMPVPMRTIVINKTDPLSLKKKIYININISTVYGTCYIQMNCIVYKSPCGNLLSHHLNKMEI